MSAPESQGPATPISPDEEHAFYLRLTNRARRLSGLLVQGPSVPRTLVVKELALLLEAGIGYGREELGAELFQILRGAARFRASRCLDCGHALTDEESARCRKCITLAESSEP